MQTYCLKCRKNTNDIDPKIVKNTRNRLMQVSRCEVCNSKKSRFLPKQEAEGLLSSLGLKTPLSKIPLFGDILF